MQIMSFIIKHSSLSSIGMPRAIVLSCISGKAMHDFVLNGVYATVAGFEK